LCGFALVGTGEGVWQYTTGWESAFSQQVTLVNGKYEEDFLNIYYEGP